MKHIWLVLCDVTPYMSTAILRYCAYAFICRDLCTLFQQFTTLFVHYACWFCPVHSDPVQLILSYLCPTRLMHGPPTFGSRHLS